jgi:hypothetical protein
VVIEALALLPIYMALLETQFVGAIEDLATQWQKSFGEGDDHYHGGWDDVKVLERVC